MNATRYSVAEWEVVQPVVKLEPDAKGNYRFDLDKILREQMLRRRDPGRDKAIAVLFPHFAPRASTSPPAQAALTPQPALAPVSPYLTAKEAARYLRRSDSWFRKHATKIPRHDSGTYHTRDLDAFDRNRKPDKKRNRPKKSRK